MGPSGVGESLEFHLKGNTLCAPRFEEEKRKQKIDNGQFTGVKFK